MLYSSRTEEAVLGAIINHKNLVYTVADKLPVDAFFDEANKFIYERCLELAEESKVDLVTVVDKCLEKKDLLPKEYEEYNIPYHVSKMTTNLMIGSADIDAHIDILIKYRSKRKLYEMSRNIKAKLEDNKDLDEIIAESVDTFADVTTIKGNTEVDMVKGFEQFMDNQNKKTEDRLIPTFLPEVDEVIGGFEYSDLIIVAGAASMGKTSFMLRLIQNLLKRDKKIGMFSLEMSNHQLLTRLLSMETDVHARKIRYNDLDSVDWNKINEAINFYKEKTFIMDETSKLTDVLNKIKKLKIKHDIDIVFIDYLQLVTHSNGRGSREQEVAKIARSLKNIAKELNIVVVALSQLSRALTQRDSKRPMLSDLRESGEIEQAADTVLLAYREAYYDLTNDEDVQDAEIIIAKGRNAGVGTANMKFKRSTVKFLSPKEDYELWGREI
jgi:replicative DNA helicase